MHFKLVQGECFASGASKIFILSIDPISCLLLLLTVIDRLAIGFQMHSNDINNMKCIVHGDTGRQFRILCEERRFFVLK